MAFLDYFRQAPAALAKFTAKSGDPEEYIFAVPLAARKFSTTGVVPKETYVFYAFIFSDSAEAAVARVRKEVRDEGYEFTGLTGKVLKTTLTAWPDFVAERFDWIKDAMPTVQELTAGSRGLVYYTPKIQMI